MLRSYRFLLLGFIVGCVGMPSPAVLAEEAPPILRVKVLRGNGSTGARTLGTNERLRSDEPATIELSVDRPSYIAVVLYAADGDSDDLILSPDQRHLAAHVPLRVLIPRYAPPGVPQTELRVLIAAVLLTDP